MWNGTGTKRNPGPHFTPGKYKSRSLLKIHLHDRKGTRALLCGLSRCLHAGCHRSGRTDKCVWSINLRYGSSVSISRSRQCWLVRWGLVGHRSNRETERIRSNWHIGKRWHWMTIASHGVIKLACRPKFTKTMLCVVSTRLRTLQN
jgi:hypothetical protein